MATHFRTRQFGFSVLAVLLAFSSLLLITSLTFAKPTGTIVVNPGDSIQAAIDAANPGDTILINVGMYTESLTLSKAVSLTGVSSATVIIHAFPDQRVITITSSLIDQSVIISGFTATGGNLTGGAVCPDYCGGGMLITGLAHPQVQGLAFIGNYAQESGGGLYADSPLTIGQVLFISNTVRHGGGGAFFKEAATINAGRFERNTCLAASADCAGGGVFAGKTLALNNSEFTSNTVASGGVFGTGGGVSASQAVTVVSTTFRKNKCQGNFCNGGGLYALRTLVATDTSFIDNMATQSSGGVYGGIVGSSLFSARFENNYCTDFSCWGGGLASDGVVTATRSIFSGNSTSAGSPGGALTFRKGRIVDSLFLYHYGIGAALYVPASGGTVEVIHSTIASGSGEAIHVEGGLTFVTNTIVSNYTTGLYHSGSAVIREDYNLYFNNSVDFSGTVITGTHDVFGDPNFVDPDNGDYHIVPPSAAINAGVDAGVYTDLDGNVRPVGGGFDIGAYEATSTTTPITGLVTMNDSPTRLGDETILVAFVQAGDEVGYLWDFGDGSTLGNHQSVTHTYPAAGIYTAVVTASNSVSVVTATTHVTVDVPLSGLTAENNSPTLFGNVTILTATISAGSNVTYTWNYGDGSPTASGITATHAYPAVGIYTASVTAQNSVSVLTATTRITITDVPVSGLTAVNSSPTAIGSVTTLTATVNAGSNVTYTWNFGDGSSLALGQVVTHTYLFSVTSHFTATVTAVNSVGAQFATTAVILLPQRVYLPVLIR